VELRERAQAGGLLDWSPTRLFDGGTLTAPNPVPAVGRCPAAAWAGIIWHADGVVQVTGSGLAPGQRVVVPST
jgi:hypothetical protein